MSEGQPKVSLLAGATGLVGAYLLEDLLGAHDFGRIIAATRRPLAREHPRLANRIVHFDRIGTQLTGFICHTAFCCLGTTLRAAGSEQAFRRVDVDYVLATARVAQAAGAQQFIVVSAAGADVRSPNFYLRTKGEMEEALAQLRFASLQILQPGVLLCWRHEMRPLELAARVLMPVINPLLLGSYALYRGISARTVALAMLVAARSGGRGIHRYRFSEIRTLAHRGAARAVL